jgi:hypothetical protein
MRVTYDIKALQTYACNDCGAQATGTTKRFTGEALTQESALSIIDARLTQREPHDMPVGWASYGRYCYRCPACKV